MNDGDDDDDDTNCSFYVQVVKFLLENGGKTGIQEPALCAAYANRHTTQLNAIQTPLQGKQAYML